MYIHAHVGKLLHYRVELTYYAVVEAYTYMMWWRKSFRSLHETEREKMGQGWEGLDRQESHLAGILQGDRYFSRVTIFLSVPWLRAD